jgi:hypothetical protein
MTSVEMACPACGHVRKMTGCLRCRCGVYLVYRLRQGRPMRWFQDARGGALVFHDPVLPWSGKRPKGIRVRGVYVWNDNRWEDHSR